MISRLDEIKVRLNEAKAGGSYKLNMDDLTWLVERVEQMDNELKGMALKLIEKDWALMMERSVLHADLAVAREALEKIACGTVTIGVNYDGGPLKGQLDRVMCWKTAQAALDRLKEKP